MLRSIGKQSGESARGVSQCMANTAGTCEFSLNAPHWTVEAVSVCNQPTRSTQPCIFPGSLNRVPASAGVKSGMSPLPGGR